MKHYPNPIVKDDKGNPISDYDICDRCADPHPEHTIKSPSMTVQLCTKCAKGQGVKTEPYPLTDHQRDAMREAGVQEIMATNNMPHKDAVKEQKRRTTVERAKKL